MIQQKVRQFHARHVLSRFRIDLKRRASALTLRSFVIFSLSTVIFAGASLFVVNQATQSAKADSCDPLSGDICIASVMPSVGSTTGGASVGSSQSVDIYGNNYSAPSYSQNTPVVITHTGLSFSRYQEVDYIQFTATEPAINQTSQYIDTGINYRTYDTSLKVEMDVAYDRITGDEQVTGFRTSGPYLWRFHFSLGNGSLYGATGSQSTPGGINLGAATTNRITAAVQHDRTSGTYSAWYNGNLVDTKYMDGPTQDVGSVLIGATRDNNGARYGSNYKVYGFKVERGGVLEVDLKPVWDIITNEFGMVDQNGNFYRNSSSGVIAGPAQDINGNPFLTSIPVLPTINFTTGGTEIGTCDNVTPISMTKLSCVPSAWDSGSGIPAPTVNQMVDVNISLGGNYSSFTNGYKYRAPMSVSAINPTIGPVNSGTSITINGTNLVPPDAADSYVRVEYIEFGHSQSGSGQAMQFIDTGIEYLMTDDSMKMEMDVEYARITGSEQVTGFRITDSYTWRFMITMLYGAFWGTTGTQGSPGGVDLGPGTTDRLTLALEYSRSSATYNAWRDEVHMGSGIMTGPNRNVGSLTIGGANGGSIVAYSSNYKVYGFRVEKEGVLVANYVPIKNISTGEYGLWDTIGIDAKWNSGPVPITGGAEIGTPNFVESVTINNNPCVVTAAASSELSCDLPADTVATRDVVISNGMEEITFQNGYTYAPTVTGVSSPWQDGTTGNVGPTRGGNTLTIAGEGYSEGAPVVTVGDVVCSNITVINDGELTCDMPIISPEHVPGTVDVIVKINNVNSIPSPSSTDDDYVFRDSMSITSITPNQGVIEGGTVVTISGINLLPPNGSTAGASVIFDPLGVSDSPAPCTVTSWTNTTIVCTTTEHERGTVDVKVTNSFESVTVTDGFIYNALSLSISSPTVTINLLPGIENFGSVAYGVESSFSGYFLYIRADDGNASTTDDADIKSTAACSDSTAKFSPISAPGVIANNTWGWKKSISTPIPGQANWLPMSLSDQEVANKNAPSGPSDDGLARDYYDVYFGAKADYTQPVCEYRAQLVATLVAAL